MHVAVKKEDGESASLKGNDYDVGTWNPEVPIASATTVSPKLNLQFKIYHSFNSDKKNILHVPVKTEDGESAALKLKRRWNVGSIFGRKRSQRHKPNRFLGYPLISMSFE